MNMASGSRDARVSVLMPTFNRADLIGQALDSVLGQSIPPHQVLVIDDGSLDGTAGVVAGYGSRVQYMRKDNGGKASALNLAMPLVTGDFVWVFDDDDVALPTSIADHLAVFERQPEAGIVIARHCWGISLPGGGVQPQSESLWPPIDASNILLWLMHGCFTMLQGALIRTACMRAVGPYREELLRSQDYDMLLRLVRRYPVGLLLHPTYLHRRHAGVRGPATIQHPVSEREGVWARYDGLIGRQLRSDLGLGEYLTPPLVDVHALSAEQERSALLNRLSVMASKGLYGEMLQDAQAFAQNCELAGIHSLTSELRGVASRSVMQGYFQRVATTEREHFLELAAPLACSAAGRALLRAFARGLMGLAWWGKWPWRERLRIIRLGLGLARRGAGLGSAATEQAPG